MKESLYDFVTGYINKKPTRLHMPGHKGVCKFLKPLGGKRDITEIPGADFLYRPQGLILSLEKRYSELYNSDCMLSTQGSTLCIQTMLALLKDRPGKLLAARNAHASFFNACALLDLQPSFLPLYIDETTQLPKPITAQQIEERLKEEPGISSIYITSPDYYGQMAELSSIAALCKEKNLLLLVDNAHGAHLNFLNKNLHPISLGADLCCDSLHKTLPALTGSALLHIKKGLFPIERVRFLASLFGSSSPSYLLMQSMDLCEEFLRKNGRDVFAKWEQERPEWKYELKTDDPLKLILDASKAGMTGQELLKFLHSHGIEGEYADDRYVILLLSPLLNKKDYRRLRKVLSAIPAKKPISSKEIAWTSLEQKKTLREALFSKQIRIPAEKSAGKISAETIYLCPPGIPVVIPGEEITLDAEEKLKKAGVSHLNVLY